VKTLSEPRLQKLQSEGVRLLACAHSALQRQLSLGDQATFGGLGLLTDLIAGVDTFLALGPGSPPDWTPALREASPPMTAAARETVVTLHAATDDITRVFEAVRLAAGLRASGLPRVALAVAPGAVKTSTELIKIGTDPIFSEHLRLFLESGGQVIAPAISSGDHDSLVRNAFPRHQRLHAQAWETRLARAFALIPF
jgi:hypothetical protein